MSKRKIDPRLAYETDVVFAYGCYFIRHKGKDGTVFGYSRMPRDVFVQFVDECDALLDDSPDMEIGAPLH